MTVWPWDHLAVGYLLYSLGVGLAAGRPPLGREAWLLAVATQFPDLVDKPLAWSFAVLPSGVSLAHSVFVAVPASALAVAVARARGTPLLGAAFAVGYLAHLPADVAYPLAFGSRADPAILLWPLVETGSPETVGFFENFRWYLSNFRDRLFTPAGVVYVMLDAALLAAALGRWVADGLPGVPFGRRQT